MSVVWWLAAGVAAFGARGGLAVLIVLAVRRLSGGRTREEGPGDMTDLVTLLTIAVKAGVPLGSAFEEASAEIGGSVAKSVDDLLRLARLKGLAAALAETTGDLGPLASQLARAQVSGASIASALEAYLATIRSDDRARLVERARTLPVRLILPISLLLLPGFVALVLGPVILEHLAGLTGLVDR